METGQLWLNSNQQWKRGQHTHGKNQMNPINHDAFIFSDRMFIDKNHDASKKKIKIIKTKQIKLLHMQKCK